MHDIAYCAVVIYTCWRQYLWWGEARGQWESHKYPFCKIYTSHLSEILALFVFLPILRLLKKKHRCLIGINIYFVRNTHLLHRRNIICGTEDTWLSQNRDTYCWMRQSCMITYFSNIFNQIWNILLPVKENISNFLENFWIHIFTSKNLAHIWKWKFL